MTGGPTRVRGCRGVKVDRRIEIHVRHRGTVLKCVRVFGWIVAETPLKTAETQ